MLVCWRSTVSIAAYVCQWQKCNLGTFFCWKLYCGSMVVSNPPKKIKQSSHMSAQKNCTWCRPTGWVIIRLPHLSAVDKYVFIFLWLAVTDNWSSLRPLTKTSRKNSLRQMPVSPHCVAVRVCVQVQVFRVNRSNLVSAGEDPETRRMRTVKNIADLRQNLEETMSSLRGTQISHR